jgi:ketosteroid isomerase-like protein
MKYLLLALLFSQTVLATSADTARTYFEAFSRRDFTVMANLYQPHQQNVFNDPIFKNLDSNQVKAMWKLLLADQRDLQLQYKIISDDGLNISIEWIAQYTYPATGQRVVNHATSRMQVRDGAIVRQNDDYSLCHWTLMALPPIIAQAACIAPDLTLRPLARKSLIDFMLKNN